MADNLPPGLGRWSGQVDATFERLMAATRVAIDTESDPFHRYFERVCLLQLSADGQDWVFDPLEDADPAAEDGGLPEGVRRLLAGEGPRLVFHGAESDVRALKLSFRLSVGPLFDTQLAARLLGKEKTGLKDLLDLELGVTIDKGEQRSDWGRRPLTSAQLAYARQDTENLLALAERLEAQLVEAGRLPWLLEECDRARTAEPTIKVFDPESWRKIKGSRTLKAGGRRALAAMVAWRDAEARALDRPPFRIVRSEALLRIARAIERQGEKGAHKLMDGRILPKGTDRMGLEAAIRESFEAPDPGRDRPPRSKDGDRAPKTAHSRAQVDRLKEARTGWAAELGIDAGFLMPASLLDRVVRARPADIAALHSIDGFAGWRAEALGGRVLDLLGEPTP